MAKNSIPVNEQVVLDEKGRLRRAWRLYLLDVDNQLQSQADWTPTAGLADGAVSFTTVAVNGAAVGWPAIAGHDKIGANNVLISAFVQAANVVRVVLQNKTGAPLTIPAGKCFVTVFRRP